MTSPRRPDFIVIGAAKSGTTSLYCQFAKHPDIIMSTRKETGFFSNNTHYANGVEWYDRFFQGAQNAGAVGEATPSYASRSETPETAERMFNLLPHVKLIYIVRHPIERMISFWKAHAVKDPGLDINEFVRDETMKCYCLDRSKYWFQLSAYRDFFPDDRFLILFFDDLKNQPAETLKKCFAFIGVDPDVEIKEPGKVYNKSSLVGVELNPTAAKVRRMPGYRLIRDIMPQSLREKLTHGMGLKKTIMVPEPVWRPEVRQWVVDELREDTEKFLQFCGMPTDYWKLD